MRRLTRRRGDDGSMAIELAAFAPVLVAVTILLIQGILALVVLVTAQQAARDGARTLMTGGSAEQAVAQQMPGWVRVEQVRTGGAAKPACSGSCVAVEVRVPLGLPGWTSSSVTVTRTAELPAE